LFNSSSEVKFDIYPLILVNKLIKQKEDLLLYTSQIFLGSKIVIIYIYIYIYIYILFIFLWFFIFGHRESSNPNTLTQTRFSVYRTPTVVNSFPKQLQKWLKNKLKDN